MRKYLTLLLLVSTSLLASCSSKPADPMPEDYRTQSIKQTRYAAVKSGEPFKVEGCEVQVHKVFGDSGGAFGESSFTLATAKCETATVTAVNEGCGKGCNRDNIRVEPLAAKNDNEQATDKAQLEEKLKELQVQAKRKADLQEKLLQLQKEADLVSAELEKAK